MLLTLLLLLALGLAALLRKVLSWRQSPLRGIPRPRGLPLLGNALQISKDKPHLSFTDWAEELGEIYCVRVFGRNLVVLNGSRSIYEALVEHGNELAGRPRSYRVGCMTNNFQNIGFSNPSRAWWLLRRVVHRELKVHGDGRQRLEQITRGILRDMKREILQATVGQDGGGSKQDGGGTEKDGGKHGRAVDIRPALYGATMGIVGAFLMGKRYSHTDTEFILFREMETLGIKLLASAGRGAELDAFPWLRHLGNHTYKQLTRFMHLRDDLYDRLRRYAVTSHVTNSANDGGNFQTGERGRPKGVNLRVGNYPSEDSKGGDSFSDGILPEMIRMANDPLEQLTTKSPYDRIEGRAQGQGGIIKHEDSRDVFTEQHVKGTFVELIMAGTASTSNLAYAFINIMLHNPAVYERARAEVRGVLESRRAAAATDVEGRAEFEITLNDRQTMPYMQAAILELLRYVCIAPFTVPHRALVDTTLCGHSIPRGTEVLCNLWALHHDQRYWDEPWHFNPERFLEPADGSGLQEWTLVPPDHPRRKNLLPFSAGPRRCTGEVFAMNRLFLVLTSLLKDFDFEPDPETPDLVPCDPRTYGLGIAFYPMDFKAVVKPTKFYCEELMQKT